MSNLFTAVSVEQQEIVAGGGNTSSSYVNSTPVQIGLTGPAALFGTYFKGKQTKQHGFSNSGWNGSDARGAQYIKDVTSIGLSFLQA
jgi:hypothetical protein